jgi:hypothetical protein
MHEPKFDFSSLDPSRSEERWTHLVDSVAERAASRYRERLTVGYQLLRWSRPVLAAAAAVSMLFGARALLSRDDPKLTAAGQYQRAYALANWARSEQRPAIANVIRVLGDSNDSQ